VWDVFFAKFSFFSFSKNSPKKAADEGHKSTTVCKSRAIIFFLYLSNLFDIATTLTAEEEHEQSIP